MFGGKINVIETCNTITGLKAKESQDKCEQSKFLINQMNPVNFE